MHTRIGPAQGSSPPFAEGRSSSVSTGPPHGLARCGHDAAVSASTDPACDAAHDALPPEFGGYRVVRLLARGSRALTALVHADGETRVARVISALCPSAAIDAEVAVHDAIRGAGPALRNHAIVLDDLVTLPDGRLALLFEQVPGPRLSDVLAGHSGRLSLGEAVTMLAPLAEALDAAHAIGITALGLQPDAVRFSASGAPVIVRVQSATVGPALPERFRTHEPAYPADLEALNRLGALVSAALREQERDALLAALQTTERGRPLVHALFDLADPLPVRFNGLGVRPEHDKADSGHSDDVSSDRAPQLAVLGVPAPSLDIDGARLPAVLSALVGTLGAMGLPAGVIDPVQSTGAHIARGLGQVIGICRGRATRVLARDTSVADSATTPRARPALRSRFVFAGVAGMIAVTAAVALVTSTDPSSQSSPSASPTVAAGAPVNGTIVAGSDERAPAGGTAPESTLQPAPEEWQRIVDTLVRRWLECRATITAATLAQADCARQVVHAGSAAEQLIAGN